MREFKDRLYFFVPTYESLGRLVAYRADTNDLIVGADIESVFKISKEDRNIFKAQINSSSTFMIFIKCRGRIVLLERPVYDYHSMYLAIEFMCPSDEVCKAIPEIYNDATILGKSVSLSYSNEADIGLVSLISDMYELFKLGSKHELADKEPTFEGIARAARSICEIIGVQLKTDYSKGEDRIFLDDNIRFSWQKCLELLMVFACVSRLYTTKRVLQMEICHCGKNFRLIFKPDYFSSKDKEEASSMINKYSVFRGQPIAYEDGCYESVPFQVVLENIGVKDPTALI